MVTLSKPISASQAQAYHKEEFANAKENYYTEGERVRGEWQGQLADRWGLRGHGCWTSGKEKRDSGQNNQCRRSRDTNAGSGLQASVIIRHWRGAGNRMRVEIAEGWTPRATSTLP